MELTALLYVLDKISYCIIHSARTFPQKYAVAVKIKKGIFFILGSQSLKYFP